MKAFDNNINRNVMMKIDYRDRRIIRELYKHQMTPIKVKEKPHLEKERGKAATYCCCYLIYIEQAISECKEYCTGIEVNGMRIQMVRFADDVTIIAQDEIN